MVASHMPEGLRVPSMAWAGQLAPGGEQVVVVQPPWQHLVDQCQLFLLCAFFDDAVGVAVGIGEQRRADEGEQEQDGAGAQRVLQQGLHFFLVAPNTGGWV